MTYDPQWLRILASGRSAIPGRERRVWSLVDSDETLSTIATPGYITDPSMNLRVSDVVFIEGSDGSDLKIASTIVGGAVTFTDLDTITDLLSRVDFLETLIVEMQPAGHGSMIMTDGPQAGADLGAGWQTLDQMNVILVSERGVTLTVDTGEIKFNANGAWQLIFQVKFSVTSSPSSARTTNIRLFNVTDAAQVGTPGGVNIGRDAIVAEATASLNFEIDASDLDDTFRFEIGGGDAVAGIMYTIVSVQCYYHDRLGNLVLPTAIGF